MSHGRPFVPIVAIARGHGRLCAVAALGSLVLLLAGCGNSPAPTSQPLDAGQAVGPASNQHLAQNGSAEHKMPDIGLPPMPNGPAPAPNPMPAPMPQSANSAGQSNDDPTQPMAADPLLDAQGFDPSPQSESEGNHNTAAGDIATAPGAHS